jgi:hypothetical protein
MVWVVVVVAVGCLVMVIGIAALGFLRGGNGQDPATETRELDQLPDVGDPVPMLAVPPEAAEEAALSAPDLGEWADELQHARGELWADELDSPTLYEREYEAQLSYLDQHRACILQQLEPDDYDRVINLGNTDYWSLQKGWLEEWEAHTDRERKRYLRACVRAGWLEPEQIAA